jgi:hypothetical protein
MAGGSFIHDDFLLHTPEARNLYSAFAKDDSMDAPALFTRRHDKAWVVAIIFVF